MGYILDTHALLWWFSNPSLLSQKAREIISDTNNVIFVSSVSTWEIVIKKSLGKLEAPDAIFKLIESEDFLELPINITHTSTLSELSLIHNDPFDRLLVAQAQFENLVLITRDKQIQKYDVATIEA